MTTGAAWPEGLTVLAIVPAVHDTSPGQRYRIEQWEPILRDHGVTVEYRPFESRRLHEILHQPGHYAEKAVRALGGVARRIGDVSRADAFDLVYVFRELALIGPGILERVLGRMRVPMVFDFDDAVYLPSPSPTHGVLTRLKFPGKTATVCRRSALVMAGNQHLAAYARQHNDNVHIVPTTIDLSRYPLRPDAPRRQPVIGWTGSHSTVPYLNTLRPVFQELARVRDFELVVIGADDYELPGVNVRAVPWKSATEAADLSIVDIGVMPLPIDQWTEGKCGCKALQYLALGIPAVCSPVGVNREIVEPGVNGYLASNSDEWLARLTELLGDEAGARAMGLRGRAVVEERYSAEVHAPRVANLFREAARTARRRAGAHDIRRG